MRSNETEKRMRWLAVLFGVVLGTALFGIGCGGDDNDPPMTPGITDAESFEVASGAAITTIASMTALVGDLPGVDVGDGGLGKRAGGLSPMRLAWEVARARIDAAHKLRDGAGSTPFVDCGAGGTAEEQCDVEAGVATATITFNDCTETGKEGTAILDGVVSIAVDRPAFCLNGEVEEGDGVTLDFDNLTATLKDPTQAVIESFAADITMAFVNEGPGCAGDDASFTMNGSMSSMSVGGATDLSLVANNLLVAVSSVGSPCVVTLRIDGSLSVDDAAGERAVSQSYDDFVMTFTEMPNVRFGFTLDGSIDVECVGRVTFDTIEQVIFIGAAECPADGLVEVTLENGTKARIGFTTAGGIEFDQGADGSVETTFPSCHHNDIEDCPS
ncbi:MAG: hypothetical protein ACKVU1_15925 [bacterium]